MARKLSGLQKEVLALYRKCIRAAHAKSPEAAPAFEQMARLSFKKYQGINTKEFTTIEHLLRKGYRSLEVYGDKQVKKCTPVAL